MGKEKTILYIEDEPGMVELVRYILEYEERAEFHIQVAEYGEQGLRMMRQQTPDLVLMDVGLPDIDGCAIYRQAKEDSKLKNIPFVFVTGYIHKVSEMTMSGIPPAHGCIRKPFSPDELLDNVYQALRLCA
jgi:CheY-like chemotaxis protein